MRVAVMLMLLAVPLAASSLVEEGQAALDRNDLRAAIDVLQKAVAATPDNAQAHYLLGCAYGKLAMQSSILRQAMLAHRTRDEFERAVSLDPDHVRARFCLVQYYTLAPNFMGGSIDVARQQAAEIAKRDAPWGHRAEAFIYGHLKNYAMAASELEQAVAADPSHMPTLFEVGHLAAISGVDLHQGEQALQRYIAYTPGPGDPPRAQAIAYLEQIRAREQAAQR
ncbi:MAG TPA: tetratricopeptide repeat protein [Thermoanaerobaculia bacterium]|nr:tetratricopeptide repeat protein [Thermoanaerobaculia bacterium]